MYLEHYQFEGLPFRNTPDPRFFLETSKHNEALANLVYAVEQRRGFVLLTGEIGSGKTLVTHLLLKQVEDHALVALIRNTHLNSSQLIRLICDEFGVKVQEDHDKATMLMRFNQFLIQQLAEDRVVIVIIDEAQNLTDKVLEELRMLSNLETSSDKLLQIVLVGQPELRDKIAQPQLEQLRQRIALSYHLEPLTYDEAIKYIDHRLRVAGPNHLATFTKEAIEKIYRFSRGMPRVINGICDNALLYGFTAGVTTIDSALVDKVMKQSMHLVPRQKVGPTRTPTYSAVDRVDNRPPPPREVARPAAVVPPGRDGTPRDVREMGSDPYKKKVTETPAVFPPTAAASAPGGRTSPVTPVPSPQVTQVINGAKVTAEPPAANQGVQPSPTMPAQAAPAPSTLQLLAEATPAAPLATAYPMPVTTSVDGLAAPIASAKESIVLCVPAELLFGRE